MTPTSFCYLDYCQGDPVVDPPIYSMLRLNQCYSFNPVPEGVNPDFILGGQGNLWSEQIATFRHVEYMAWPRGWALAEDFWSPDSKKSWNGFIQRVENQFERSAVAQINYSKAMYDAIVNIHLVGPKMLVEMATEVPDMEIFYSVDGSMPDHFSLKYTVPFELPEGPVTLRVVTYRNGSEIGHLITLKPEDLKARAK
jgi:hexosaminidase